MHANPSPLPAQDLGGLSECLMTQMPNGIEFPKTGPSLASKLKSDPKFRHTFERAWEQTRVSDSSIGSYLVSAAVVNWVHSAREAGAEDELLKARSFWAQNKPILVTALRKDAQLLKGFERNNSMNLLLSYGRSDALSASNESIVTAFFKQSARAEHMLAGERLPLTLTERIAENNLVAQKGALEKSESLWGY